MKLKLKHLFLSSTMGLMVMSIGVFAQEEKRAAGKIVNGEFNSSATGHIPHWSGWGLRARPLNENDIKGCRLILPEKTANGWYSSETMTLQPGKEYFFTFKIRKSGECRFIPFLVVLNREDKKKSNVGINFFPMSDATREISEWTEFFGTVKVPNRATINAGYIHFYVDRNQDNTTKFSSTDEKHIDLSGLQLREL